MDRAEITTARIVSRQLYIKGQMRRITSLLADAEIKLTEDLASALARLSVLDQGRLIEGQIKTDRLKRLVEIIKAFSNEWAQITQAQMEAGALDLIEAEMQFEQRFVERFGPDTQGVAASLRPAITPRQVFNAANRRPMDTKLMRELYPDMALKVRRNVTASLRESYMAGDTLPQAMKNLRRHGLKSNRYGVETMARTGLAHYAYQASRETLERLDADRFLWVSVLDGRTSSQCQALDGQVFKVGDKRMPPIPRHPNCRSTIAPLFEGETVADMGGTRASKGVEGGKQVDAAMNYETWLRKQPDSFAREVLGPTKYKIWKDGVPVSRFTDKYARRVYTADELKQQYSSLFDAELRSAA